MITDDVCNWYVFNFMFVINAASVEDNVIRKLSSAGFQSRQIAKSSFTLLPDYKDRLFYQ